MAAAVEVFELKNFLSKEENFVLNFRHYWQLIEERCTSSLLRSQADEWIQTALAEAFQKNLVHSTDWMNKPLPECVRRSIFCSAFFPSIQISQSNDEHRHDHLESPSTSSKLGC